MARLKFKDLIEMGREIRVVFECPHCEKESEIREDRFEEFIESTKKVRKEKFKWV